MIRSFFLLAVWFFSLFLAGCGNRSKVGDEESPTIRESIPEPAREFRAAWVATVDNIDWPSEPGLSAAQQRAEAIAILQRATELNMNAIVLQVRPQADALYVSSLEPWSYYLTGEQGRAPKEQWDPLVFWIDEAHKRGMQLHAWFNPFRANHPANRGQISRQSVVRKHPDLVVKLGDKGYWWLVPTEERSRRYTLDVIADVVGRYDLDGVHLDDYFYPYPVYNNNRGFPDDVPYADYQKKGGELSRGDWRREAVNKTVREIAEMIKSIKPGVEFGISPFGIWRPGHPPGIAGMDQYETLHADARLWLREGWIDYFSPQLYWPISSRQQSFPLLLGWWQQHNLKNRHIWPGLLVANNDTPEEGKEIENQVMVTRGFCRSSPGNVLYSMNWVMEKEAPAAKALSTGPWAEAALIPQSEWIQSVPPESPKVDVIRNEGTLLLRFQPGGDEEAFQFVLNEKKGGKWMLPRIIPGRFRSVPLKREIEAVAVRSVDRFRNMSQPAVFRHTP